MNKILCALGVAALAAVPALAIQQDAAKQAAPKQRSAQPYTLPGQLTLYEMADYNGASMVIDSNRTTVHTNWNIRSLSVHPGERWQICARSRYRDPCIVLDRSVHDASLIGVDGQIGSARPAPAEPEGD